MCLDVHLVYIIFHSLLYRIQRFLEKPEEGVTTSRLASVVFYCLRKETLSYLSDFLLKQPDVEYRTFGRLWVSALLRRKKQKQNNNCNNNNNLKLFQTLKHYTKV